MKEDKGIESYDFYEHFPFNSTLLNEHGRPVEININNQGIKILPSKSLLNISGQIIAKDKDGKIVDKLNPKSLENDASAFIVVVIPEFSILSI